MSACKLRPEGCPSYFANLPVCGLPNGHTGAMYTAFYVNKDAQPFRSAIQTLVWFYPYTGLQAVTFSPRFRSNVPQFLGWRYAVCMQRHTMTHGARR